MDHGGSPRDHGTCITVRHAGFYVHPSTLGSSEASGLEFTTQKPRVRTMDYEFRTTSMFPLYSEAFPQVTIPSVNTPN
ncbi:hypothetical protein TNCV_4640401 [Trichonephila clavipes]|nr:hypothetical protein TNCV_4640401 [Trichonephila clavipes]